MSRTHGALWPGIGLAAGLLVAGWAGARVGEPAHARPPAVATSPPSVTSTTAPRRLQIPGIGVDAAIDPVGVTTQGDLATPTDVSHAGWYRAGSLPGRPGSSVIDGHRDWYSGPAVFANLGHLHPTDPLSVTYSDGSAAFFRVSNLVIYPANARPPAELFRTDGPPQLVLITCAGPWDGTRYRDRLVVVSRPDPTHRRQNLLGG